MITLNGTPLNPTIFPDNTSQVWKLDKKILTETNWAHIVWEFSHEGEFMHLAQLKYLLDEYGVDSALRIKYLPYGRQDKLIGNEKTFALSVFAVLLNSLHFNEIIIHDPHSSVALDLIKGSRAVYPIQTLNKLFVDYDFDLAIYPDNGAVTKYSKIYTYPYLYGEKVRDQLTGNILSYKLWGLEPGNNVKDKDVLIIDDICDGGMTFKLLAEELNKLGARSVSLFVTHGIFSKGLKTLRDSGIKRVFTQDGEVSETQNQLAYRRL